MNGTTYRAYKTSSLYVKHVEKHSLLNQVGNLEGKVLLDLGCGGGYYTKELVLLQPAKLIAIDQSPSMLDNARAYTQDFSPEFHLGNHRLLKKYKDQIDVIVANMVLPFAKNETELLEIAAFSHYSLKADGKFIGFLPDVDATGDWNSLRKYGFTCNFKSNPPTVSFYNAIGDAIQETHFNAYSLQTIEEAFEFFKNTQFIAPKVDDDGIAEYGKMFWKELLKPPKILLFEASK